MQKTVLSTTELLNFIPQQKPFRFIEEIISVSENEIWATYTFKKDEYFYSGHFPKNPLTPGVILLESMCQVGLVALGIYLLSLEIEPTEIKNWLTVFTDAEVEFFKSVYPGDSVIIKAKKIFWRRMKLKSTIQMFNENENLVATSTASGIWIRK